MDEAKKNFWYPFADRKEFLTVVARRSSRVIYRLIANNALSVDNAVSSYYKTSYYKRLEDRQIAAVWESDYRAYHTVAEELGLKYAPSDIPPLCDCPRCIIPFCYTLEYLKLFFRNEHGYSPLGADVFFALDKIDFLEDAEDIGPVLEEYLLKALELSGKLSLPGYSRI